MGRFLRLGELHPRRFFLETWAAIHAEALAEGRAAEQAARVKAVKKWRRSDFPLPAFSLRPLLILVASAILLTLMEYFGGWETFKALFPEAASDPQRVELYRLAYWAAARMLGYGILPALLVLMIPGERIADYGLRIRGVSQHLWIYVALYLAVFPVIVLASFHPEFKSYYPFLKNTPETIWNWRTLLAWELLYAGQFLALEFFFRGFLLQSLRRQFGAWAIFVAVVPYCMIHYGKPFLEAMGAIVAGIVLGTLALRTGSIWCGFLVHVSVAVTMDFAALIQRNDLPRAW